MNTMLSLDPVRAHYYVHAIPRVIACASVNEALRFCRQAYDDPKLGAIALEIRFVADDLDGMTWRQSFDRALAGHNRHSGRWIEPGLFPKCVTASYRTGTSRAHRAFTTLIDALEFIDFDVELEMARLRVHLTASDVWRIVPVTLYDTPARAWDLAVDSVLHSRVMAGHAALDRQPRAA